LYINDSTVRLVEIRSCDITGFLGTTALLWFENGKEQDIVFTVQMPHAWKEGITIYPHVHWTVSTDVGTSTVKWGLEYTWPNAGKVFSATTIISGDTPVAEFGEVKAFEHTITPLGGIIATVDDEKKTLSSMLVCRLFRNSSAGTDTYNYDAGLFEIDFHYQIDNDGSNAEYTKW